MKSIISIAISWLPKMKCWNIANGAQFQNSSEAKYLRSQVESQPEEFKAINVQWK